MTPEQIQQSRRVLLHEEGVRLKPYQDHLGNWTIGVGRLIGKDIRQFTISERTADQMLLEDMMIAFTAIERIYGRERVAKFTTPRVVALVSMAFQMGEAGLLKFTKMNQAIREGDWETAAEMGRQSLWYREQTPKRAERMMRLLTDNNFEAYQT